MIQPIKDRRGRVEGFIAGGSLYDRKGRYRGKVVGSEIIGDQGEKIAVRYGNVVEYVHRPLWRSLVGPVGTGLARIESRIKLGRHQDLRPIAD
jgi:hypothetical protein